MAETVIVHPNRDKAASKATKAAVILLLLVSAALVLIVTVGGWSQLQGAQMVSVAYVIIYLTIAYFVGRWNRGTLPVASGLAVLLLVVAAIAVALVPRVKSPLQLAALTGALIAGFELVLTHWFYLYIPWFYPFAAFALLAVAPAVARRSPPEEHRETPPRELVAAS